MLEQISGYHGPAKLTHKINHHLDSVRCTGGCSFVGESGSRICNLVKYRMVRGKDTWRVSLPNMGTRARGQRWGLLAPVSHHMSDGHALWTGVTMGEFNGENLEFSQVEEKLSFSTLMKK